MVRKIQGKGKSSSLGHLKVKNENVTSKKDISHTLGHVTLLICINFHFHLPISFQMKFCSK